MQKLLSTDRKKLTLVVLAVAGILILALWRFNIRLPEVSQLALRAYGGEELAVHRLREMGPDAVPSLTSLLRAQDLFTRKILWRYSPHFPRAVQRYLFQNIGYPQQTRNREAAAHALALLGPKAETAVPALAQAMQDTSGRVRWKAAEALAKIGAPAVPALAEAAQSVDEETRAAAVYALGLIGRPAQQAVPVLFKSLEDTSEGLRSSAAQTLRQIGAAPSEPLLAALRNPHAREPAASALYAFYGSPASSITNLLSLARSAPEPDRILAIQTLAAAGLARNDVLDRLSEWSTNGPPDVQVAAKSAFETLSLQRPDRFPAPAP
jgi:HEAT repeat protein